MRSLFFLHIFLLIHVESSKILFVQPSFSKSHVMPLQKLAKKVAEKGHKVTFLSQYPLNSPFPKYNDIKLIFNYEYQSLIDDLTRNMNGGNNMFKTISIINKINFGIGNEVFKVKSVQKLMENEKFDLVVIGYFANEYLLGLADHFKCPSIMFSSGSYIASLHKMIGNPLAPEGTFSVLSQSRGTGYVARIKNFFIYGIELLFSRVLFYYQSKSIYE